MNSTDLISVALILLVGFAILVSQYGLYGALLFILLCLLIGIGLFIVIYLSERFGQWLSDL